MSSSLGNPSATASTNGHTANGDGKAAQSNRLATSLVQVQPARREDLQPRYAQQIAHDDENPAAHSWYASMSK